MHSMKRLAYDDVARFHLFAVSQECVVSDAVINASEVIAEIFHIPNYTGIDMSSSGLLHLLS